MESFAETKVIDGIIRLTDWQKIKNIHQSLTRLSSVPNWTIVTFNQWDINNIKNDLIFTSRIIAKEYAYFSNELFLLKDYLFVGYGCLNPQVYGQIIAIFKVLLNECNNPMHCRWNLIHPQISVVSKQLFLDGHYANAACDAFIEINDRVKKIYKKVNSTTSKIPDGDSLMTSVFSANNPLLKVCDTSTETGQNEQKGLMFMLQGAMSALRNPKAHANIKLTAEDAMRRIMFASMLMYKIDEAVKYSNIQE